MLLIADGGSTKCDWIVLNHETGEEVLRTHTQGLNPAVFALEVLQSRLTDNPDLAKLKTKISNVHFFGAGCGTPKPTAVLQKVLETYFNNSKVKVAEDMLAAVYAATDKPGIVCILGTGSNSCYFDGQNTQMFVDSLGYILMDEASGNYYGKQLIRDYYYQKMPQHLAKVFAEKYNLDSDEIKKNIYKNENPNTYLAGFAQFIFESEIQEPYFEEVITKGIEEFVNYRVLCYPESKSLPIHFIGSIAHFSTPIIKKVLDRHGLQLGNIVRKPIEGMIRYYQGRIQEGATF